MRSKPAEPLPPPRPLPTARRMTLAAQIVLLVVGVAVAVAAFAGVVGTALIRTVATDVTRTYLADEADVLAGQLDDQAVGAKLGLGRLTNILKQQGVYVVNLGKNGLTGAEKRAVTAAQAAGVAGLTDGGKVSRTVTVSGKSLLVEGRSVNGRTFALVTAVDEGPAAVQRALERRVVWALVIGVGAALVIGLFFAWRVGRPLRRTAALARAMGSGARDVRAPVAGPREVAEVGVAVNELAGALAHSEARQRDFLASVSHELRTPLAAVNGQAQALADGIVPPSEVADVGRTITAEAARLDRLVSDLLDLARLGADSFRLEIAPCDVISLVAEMDRVWRVRCEARGAVLRLELPPGPVLVSTDARRLRQVLDGLAENALRLLGPGQPLVLAVLAGSEVVLQVRDGGPGLAPEDYPVAFERGVLHDRYRGKRPGGAGLGLALAHSLVERLGGTIAAGPAPEGGAAMTIRLPR